MPTTSEAFVARVLAANKAGRIEGGDKSIEKSGKLLKTGKSSKSGNLKGKKSSKSKKPLKNKNLPNFSAKKAGPSFLTPKARAALNCLRLAFTEAPILQYFDPKCYIQIETKVLGSAIGGMLN